MKKIVISSIVGLSMLAPLSSALAYHLPAATTITPVAPFTGGSGEVDLSRASSVTGTFSTDNNSDENIWVTAGDVAGGHSGYGFFMSADKLYGITHDEQTQAMVFLGFVPMNRSFTVKATYVPAKGIQFDTASISSDWSQYSRGVIQDNLPNPWMRGFGAVSARMTSRSMVGNLWLGAWEYN